MNRREDIEKIIEILEENDPIDSSCIPDFSFIVSKIKDIHITGDIFDAVKEIAFGNHSYFARSTAIGVLYELDGALAAKLMLFSYINAEPPTLIWIIQMSARSSSQDAARLLESLAYFETDDENRAEIIESLGHCGNDRSIKVLESIVQWDDGYSWDGLEIRNIARAAIAGIKFRLQQR